MLTTDQIRALLERITYKDGWDFYYYRGKFEGPHLVISFLTEDSFNPGADRIKLDVHTFLSPNDIASEDAFLTYLAHRLARLEIHEMREFLKIDGKVVFNPHAEGADHDR